MLKIGSNYKFIKHLSLVPKMPKQNYDSFLVLDFEATCEEGTRIKKPEIIEFPVLKVDGKTFYVTERFHRYVKPVVNPQLSTFCTKLTGITQEMVDDGSVFADVFGNFQAWLMEEVGPKERFLFVTCGDWDLRSMLPDQCKRENVILPPYFNTWMNIKKAFAYQTGCFTKGMMEMLHGLNIKHEGRHHSGIDDCSNIAKILTALNESGCVFRPTAGGNRHGPPPPPQLAMYAQTGACSNSKSEQQDKANLYPSLVGCDSDSKDGHSSIYEPDDHSHSEMGISEQYNETNVCEMTQEHTDCQTSFSDKDRQLECPDFPTIVLNLQKNLLAKAFKPRDQEELQALCAAGKYLDLMKEEDRNPVMSRLRHFYVMLVYGRKVAKKDSPKFLSTVEVGIHVDQKLINSGQRHKQKTRKLKHKQQSGTD